MKEQLDSLSEEGLWQLVDSGEYRADLPLWEELAGEPEVRILDIGCGIGRVSRHLDRLGHQCIGIDSDAEVVRDFNRMRRPGSQEALMLDATRIGERDCPLLGQTFDLILAPQQLLQVLPGAEERIRMLRSLPDLLASGGLMGFAICEDLPLESISYPEVPPDLLSVDGWLHSSQPVEIVATDDEVRVMRFRRSEASNGEGEKSLNEVALQRLDRETAALEFFEAGLSIASFESVPATERHMASTAIIAHPASA